MLGLPEDLRAAFSEPLGPVHADVAELLAAAADARERHDAPDAPLVAVGDVVTANLCRAGHEPDVAVVDGRTERRAVDPRVAAATPDPDTTVENPPATLSTALLTALADAIAAAAGGEQTAIRVDGEEDLAALPAVLAAPRGASVVYGQPGEGMVLVVVTPEVRQEARDLLSRMDGDTAAALAALEQS